MMKTIWIDILHIPQLNFYKPFIKMLSEHGYCVLVTVLDRGRLAIIAQKELANLYRVSVTVIGRHRMKKWSVLLEANLLRLLRLLLWVPFKHIDMAFSNGSHVGIIGWLYRFPTYEFEDDPQAKDYGIMCKFATKEHSMLYELPEDYKLHKRGTLLPVLKEWAYLNTRLFMPSRNVLESYKVSPKKYIFLREVSVGTFNYASQAPQAILAVKDLIAKLNMKVLFSLEEKHRRNEYPEDWILLQEPIEDIHSLIYYAAGLVSSGDSMAREAALLGIPAYYLGTRHSMPANLAAAKVANLQNELTMPFEKWLGELNEKSVEERMKAQEELRKKIDEEFIDINAYMMSLVEGVK